MRLAKPAGRIIALSGALAETLLAMNLGDRLAARTDADGDLPALADKPSIGTHMRPNLELVLGASPDLIVQLAGRKESLESVAALRRLGLPVAVFRIDSFEELFSAVERLGILTGEQTGAEELVISLKKRLDRLRAETALQTGQARPRVFFEIRYPNLLCAGRDSIVNAVIEAAGGENAVSTPERVARPGEEELLRLDPDVYLVQRGPMNENPSPPAERPHFKDLRAVRQGRVYLVTERLYSRPGPGAVAAAEELAAELFPDKLQNKEPKPAGAAQ